MGAYGGLWAKTKVHLRVACKQVLGIGGAWCMHRVSVDEHWLIELVADLPTLLSNAERLLSTKLSHVAQAQGATRGSLGALGMTMARALPRTRTELSELNFTRATIAVAS